MPKKRTTINTKVVPRAKPKGLKTSAFLITINPNISTPNPDSDRYKELQDKLAALGDYLLRKKNIVKYLDFENKDGDTRDREAHLEAIEWISPDRTAAVELKSKTIQHLHLFVEFKHRTYMHFNRNRLLLVASHIVGQPAEKFHLNIRVQGVNSFRDYVQKYGAGAKVVVENIEEDN